MSQRRNAMDSIFTTAAVAPPPSLTPVNGGKDAPSAAVRPRRETSGLNAPLGAISTQLSKITEGAKIADRVEAGAAIVELDTALIDGSFVADRIADVKDPSLEALTESIREKGQHLPILVRPHPDDKDRYQVAYGHRRLAACKRLGRKVRAIVKTLTDAELVIIQGNENLDRRDLSYIEKAYFALRLERHGFDRATITQALATDKPEVSRYISIATAIPEEVVTTIGPAPKAGRTRWVAMEKAFAKPEAAEAAWKAMSQHGFQAKDSDTRFAIVLAAVSVTREAPEPIFWRPEAGGVQAKITRSSKGASISFDTVSHQPFVDFLLSRMDTLFDEYAAGAGE